MAEINTTSALCHAEHKALLEAILVDLTSLKTEHNKVVDDLAALKSAHDTLATKLNADAGVTDTNYAATAALTATADVTLTVTTD